MEARRQQHLDRPANAMGMHHDGMHFFPINGSSEDGLLAINFEYIDTAALHPAGPTTDVNGKRPVEEVRKEINAHGAGVVRLQKVSGRWQVVDNDPLNRRFTTLRAWKSPARCAAPTTSRPNTPPPVPTAAVPTTTAATAIPRGAPT